MRGFAVVFPLCCEGFATIQRIKNVNFLLQKRKYVYLCSVYNNITYSHYAPLSTDNQKVKENVVECCGELLPADADLLQRVMTRRRLPLEEQMLLWRSLYRQWPDPAWARVCLERARDISALLALDRSLFPPTDHSASTADASEKPLSPTVERHFVWLGDRYAISAEVLRNGISQLASAGLISTDRDQQTALRRCLGLALNEQERSSDPPWVLWIGPADMLNYLIDSLWELRLIHCPGGNRLKWQTLCGAFLRADRSRFPASIKSNRCTNPEKLKTLDRALLSSLRLLTAMH